MVTIQLVNVKFEKAMHIFWLSDHRNSYLEMAQDQDEEEEEDDDRSRRKKKKKRRRRARSGEKFLKKSF